VLFIDQLNREVEIPEKPQRIVSLVPSQTELLYHLGIRPVAQTLFCVHPSKQFKQATKIGGTKKLNIAKIKSLAPDLILGNKEENLLNQIETLSRSFPVWLSDIYTLDDALGMILSFGQMLQLPMAEKLSENISHEFQTLDIKLGSCLYLIWQKPTMVVGRNTFINNMLEYAGFENVLIDPNGRYPALNKAHIHSLKPEFILLSSEPYPFGKKDLEYFQNCYPFSKVVLVDATYFSWYGSRLQDSPAYFRSLADRIRS
jgi:ABC-type Fe3+-hydroxamate transport system substrate-binding protein